VVNTGLKPWTADNYRRVARVLIRESGRDFDWRFPEEHHRFLRQTRRTRATADLLAQYDMPDDYLDYDVITKNNVGDARRFRHRL
jgi:hypothetical protein